ncbi:MAG: hypothetical protein ACOCZB_08965, partial [Spirochaetota bacterium]
GAPGFRGSGTYDEPVSIHAPAWGATVDVVDVRHLGDVSIHAPAWGATEHDGKPVTNGEELCACKAVDVYGLVTEIFLFIWRGVALGEDREKN